MKRFYFFIIIFAINSCLSKNETLQNNNIYSNYMYIKQIDTVIFNKSKLKKIDIELGFNFKGYLYEENEKLIYTTNFNEKIVLINYYNFKNEVYKVNKCNISQITNVSSIYKKDDILFLLKIDFIKNKIEEENYTNKFFIISKNYGVIGVYTTLENKIFKGTGTIFTFERIL